MTRTFFHKGYVASFLIFNTFMVVRANQSAAPIAGSSIFQRIQRGLAYRPPFLSNSIDGYISWYSYLSGTDLIAVMFSTQSRREWLFWITATYLDGTEVTLPLARQSPRSFLQRTFVDNKEAKFHNNLYSSGIGQRLYANYLCRQFPMHNAAPIRSISFKVRWRDFFSREAAAASGHYAQGPFYDYPLADFPCPTASSADL